MSALIKYPVDQALQPVAAWIATGRNSELDAQLIQKSFEPNIVEQTPNDSRERFGDQAMLERWMQRGRQPYYLLTAGNDLAGLIWYGPTEFPLESTIGPVPQHTFAIRIYDGYAGHGLAKPFMKQTLRLYLDYLASKGEALTGIWLQTDVRNDIAKAVYGKFGYELVHEDDKRVTMVLTPDKINEIVSSP